MAAIVLSSSGDLTTSRTGISRSHDAVHSYSLGFVAAAAVEVRFAIGEDNMTYEKTESTKPAD